MLLLLLIIEKIDSDQSRNNHQIEIYKIFRALMMQKNVAMKRDDANISMIFAAVRTNTLRLYFQALKTTPGHQVLKRRLGTFCCPSLKSWPI